MKEPPPVWRPDDRSGRHAVGRATNSRLVLLDGLMANGARVDVVLSDGLIAEVVPAGDGEPQGADTTDLDGRLLLPAFAEPHTHLDKALTADAFPNSSGGLNGAIEAIKNAWGVLTVEDTFERAHVAASKLVASGTTAIRSHADVIPESDLRSVEALVAVKRRIANVADLQVVAMTHPLTGPDRATGRRALEQAIEIGADVVGGAPYLEDDPGAAIAFGIKFAADHSLAVDFHMDEVLDESVQYLGELAQQTTKANMQGRVAASHCVSHGLLSLPEQRELSRMLADSGVSVVTLPRTNLFLQARGIEEAPPRALPGLRSMLEAGVTVAAGADNVQDPFYPIGRLDPLETATFLIAVAHFTIGEAFQAVTTASRQVMGLEPPRITQGSPAEIVAVRASSVREAIAEQPADRIVIHGGRVVARTRAESSVAYE